MQTDREKFLQEEKDFEKTILIDVRSETWDAITDIMHGMQACLKSFYEQGYTGLKNTKKISHAIIRETVDKYISENQ